MENKDWINEYMLLNQVNPVNPFTVPDGYFDSLEDRIVSNKMLDDLKDLIPSDGFTVPENYFETLADDLESIIALDNIINNTDAGFTVPDGYFHTLEQQIQSRILIEQTVGVPGEHFTVPEGYFERLNSKILNRTVNHVPNERNGIIRKLFASTAVKYATAACFALAIGGGILLNELTDPINVHNRSFLHKQLSTVPVDELKDYLQLNVDAGDTQHMILTGGAAIDDEKLKDALQDYVDSVQ